MGGKNYYVPGDYNVVCDVCSKKIKSGEAKQRWDGLVVCPDDYEQRHAQDFVQTKQDKITVPFTRPIPELLFTNVVYICTPEGSTARTGWAVAGCSIVGKAT